MSTNDPLNQKSFLQIAIEKNACPICRIKQLPICIGGHASGGSSGSNNTAGEDDKGTLQQSHQAKDSFELIGPAVHNKAQNLFIEAPINIPTFEKIAALLSVESDHLSGTLTLRANPDLSNTELKALHAFFNAVKAEFQKFTKHLPPVFLQDNVLTLHIPSPSLYTAFIQHLIAQHLLVPSAIRQVTQQEENSREAKANHYFNPLPTTLKPYR